MLSTSSIETFIISIGNNNPTCSSLPLTCIYTGIQFLYDLTSYCTDPEGHDVNMNALFGTPIPGVLFDNVNNEIFGTPTAVVNAGAITNVDFFLTDNVMVGTAGPFQMGFQT